MFFVNGPAHPIFTEIVEKRADIRLDKLKNDSADDVATPVLAGAHAYQIGSARDELAKKYHAGPDLLRRTQSLLIVSTNGAGYDTVNLKACTEAGVLCLNQAGGNKEAVAEHALAMMLSLSKRIVEADRAIRREILEPQHLHGPRPARPDRRHRRPRQCRQAPRGAVPRPVPDAGAVLRPVCVGRRDEAGTASRRSISTR